MEIIEVIVSLIIFSIGTLLKFIGIFTAAAIIGIPILIIGDKMQKASEKIGRKT